MLSLLCSPESFWIVLLGAGLFGLAIGSFLNVVIVRLPRVILQAEVGSDSSSINILFPSSHCPQCNHPIPWYLNIPLLSFCWLKGKCAYCRQKISWRYPLVEFLSLILSVLVAARFGPSLIVIPALLLTWALIALSFIDFDHTILPDDITLPFIWLGLFLNTFSLFTEASSAILGAVLGYLTLFSVYWIFKLITKKEGLGYGDFKLLAMLGAWLGWQALPFIILLSSLLGTIVGLSLILFKGRDRNLPMPFGPFLALAGFAVMVWGPDLTLLYYKITLL